MSASDRARRMASSISLLLLAMFVVVGCIKQPSAGTRTPRLVSPTLEARPVDEPIRLVARDGTDMPLVSLEVRGTVEDPLAFTELTLEFENLEPRSLDATLSVALPPRARVT
ncbi:MAG: hypothetical protein KC457_30330, partial [Myxococcales bacterium]|nr:hypothetical protein [Myxococcales bacterium]